MSRDSFGPQRDDSYDAWEAEIHETASGFPYPPTPDVRRAVRERIEQPPRRAIRVRLAQAALIAVLALAALLAIPQVRAGLLQVLQVGGVRILLPEATETATPTRLVPTSMEQSAAAQATAPGPTRTPRTTPTAEIASISDLAGETSLSAVRDRVSFPIRLPTYPDDLGPPDRVFLQDFGGSLVVLVWADAADPSKARVSLHILGPGVEATKGPPEALEITRVDGNSAFWTTGPYMLAYGSADNVELSNSRRLIDGHVLIWADGDLTYRLETALSLEEAVRIAESLR